MLLLHWLVLLLLQLMRALDCCWGQEWSLQLREASDRTEVGVELDLRSLGKALYDLRWRLKLLVYMQGSWLGGLHLILNHLVWLEVVFDLLLSGQQRGVKLERRDYHWSDLRWSLLSELLLLWSLRLHLHSRETSLQIKF